MQYIALAYECIRVLVFKNRNSHLSHVTVAFTLKAPNNMQRLLLHTQMAEHFFSFLAVAQISKESMQQSVTVMLYFLLCMHSVLCVNQRCNPSNQGSKQSYDPLQCVKYYFTLKKKWVTLLF